MSHALAIKLSEVTNACPVSEEDTITCNSFCLFDLARVNLWVRFAIKIKYDMHVAGYDVSH